MSEVLTIEPTPHASIVRLTRDDKLNAISAEVERALCDAVAAPEVRDAPCVIFTGSARAFSAGADRSEWRDDAPGPSKRIYELTDEGRRLLGGWADALRTNQELVSSFLDRYGEHEPQLADVSLLYLAARLGIRTVFTLDPKEVTAYRLPGDRHLRIVPDRD